jgi:alpha-tubulin suppressor-like RCC1 family protein
LVSDNRFSGTPIQLAGLKDVVAVDGCGGSACALLRDGTVMAWGYQDDTESRLAPCPVAGLAGVKAIAAESGGGYALSGDGSLWAWGRQEPGGKEGPVAVQVEGVPKFDFLGRGFAATAEGDLWAWSTGGVGCSPAKVPGFSSVAEACGDTSSIYDVRDTSGKVFEVDCGFGAPVTTEVPGLSEIVAIARFVRGAFALRDDGTVWVWGDGYFGIYGAGSESNRGFVPVQVGGLPKITHLSVDWYTCYALAETGEVWAWGRDDSGQLGQGATACSLLPIQAPELSDAVAVTGSDDWAIALKKDGTVWVWGHEWAALRPATEEGESAIPVQVPALREIRQVVAANQTAYALAADGSIWVWGYTDLDDVTGPRAEPMQLPGVAGAVSIAGSSWNGYAVMADGALLGWGSNEQGQLGVPASDEFIQPGAIAGLPKIEAVAAATGSQVAYALDDQGNVWAWGQNSDGQLGDGSTQSTSTPAKIGGLPRVTMIAADPNTGYAVDADGQVWIWGYSAVPFVGEGETSLPYGPVKMPLDRHITAVVSGWSMTLFLASDGSVWALGYNDVGQIGDGTFDNALEAPAQTLLKPRP